MDGTPSGDSAWTDADTEALFATIGRYLLTFQWIEGKLDQILLLGWGEDNRTASQARLAGMRNFEKINAVKELVLNSPDFARVHTRPDWCTEFELLIEHLHNERSRRNTLIHSQYLFRFTEIGLPPIMSHRQRLDGEPKFIRQILDKDAQQKLLNDLGKLVIDINFTLVQLIHDYEAPFVPNSPASRQRPLTEPL